MSETPRLLLVGASGLIGREVIRLAVGREDFRLLALSRRELDLPPGARMEVLLADPSGWREAIMAIAPDRVICALGTTRRKEGGDEAALAAVDRDLVVDVCRHAKEAGAKGFVVVSSVGADRQSRNHYLRTKGEMEQQLMRVGIDRLDVLRPGLLRGERTGDRRPLERLAMLASPLVDLFLHGKRSKYRSISATEVAAAAIQCSRERAKGKFAFHHTGIRRMARRLPRG